MVNNIGKTTKTLSTDLGANTQFTEDDITIITGGISQGLLIFDTNGTLGVVSNYESETNFTVTTYAVSIDIPTILNLKY